MDPEQNIDEEKVYNGFQSAGSFPVVLDPKKPSGFICGDCGKENHIKEKEPIRCKHCGYRILYKQRSVRPIPFLAR